MITNLTHSPVNHLIRLRYLTQMREAALSYRVTLTASWHDGDWNDRIRIAKVFLKSAKFWRKQAQEN